MCCLTRSALPATSSASWIHPKQSALTYLCVFSICNCFLMRLIRHRGMLKMRSSNTASVDNPALYVGVILDPISLWTESPITLYNMHLMFSHYWDGWQLQTGWVWEGGIGFPAARTSLDNDDGTKCWSSQSSPLSVDHDMYLACCSNEIFMRNPGRWCRWKFLFFHRSIIKWGSDEGLRQSFRNAVRVSVWGLRAGKQVHSACRTDEHLFS